MSPGRQRVEVIQNEILVFLCVYHCKSDQLHLTHNILLKNINKNDSLRGSHGPVSEETRNAPKSGR
jgi:hypothetical protein